MRLAVSHRHVPLLATAGVFVLLYAACGLRYHGEGFLSLQVLLNLFGDNSVLGIAAVGITFVILSGGIDLSVGSMVALASILLAVQVEKWGVPAPVAMLAVLAGGAAFGLGMGCTIHFFGLPPFIVTLAGMFLARGLGFVLHIESIAIHGGFYREVTGWGLWVAGARLPLTALVFLVVVAAGIYLSTCTTFGRNVYAIGGSEEAALLMGVPVGRTKLLVYALSGACSALAGIVFSLYGSSGDPRAGLGMELDAIAAAVIGGTLLGVLIFGIIHTGVTFENLNSWWTRVAIGLLLFLFVLLQKLLARPGQRAG